MIARIWPLSAPHPILTQRSDIKPNYLTHWLDFSDQAVYEKNWPFGPFLHLSCTSLATLGSETVVKRLYLLYLTPRLRFTVWIQKLWGWAKKINSWQMCKHLLNFIIDQILRHLLHLVTLWNDLITFNSWSSSLSQMSWVLKRFILSQIFDFKHFKVLIYCLEHVIIKLNIMSSHISDWFVKRFCLVSKILHFSLLKMILKLVTSCLNLLTYSTV